MSSKPKESDEVFDARWQAYFSRYGQPVFDTILILLLSVICNMQFTGLIDFPLVLIKETTALLLGNNLQCMSEIYQSSVLIHQMSTYLFPELSGRRR